MIDSYNRRINYLRISVTDRCNLRCTYCMPAGGIHLKQHADILSFHEILEVVKTGAELGINKVRLTGGEPLVRKNIPELVQMVRNIREIEDIGLTTNGVLLPVLAKALKDAGLDRVNISLDTIDPVKYKKITRQGNLNDVFAGISAAKEAGLLPIKINFVSIPGVNNEDKEQVKKFCRDNNLQIRMIRQMNLETGEFYPVEGGDGGNCPVCNRLRLTADGYLIPCLHANPQFSIRELGVKEAYRRALHDKPFEGKGTKNHQFYNIGG